MFAWRFGWAPVVTGTTACDGRAEHRAPGTGLEPDAASGESDQTPTSMSSADSPSDNLQGDSGSPGSPSEAPSQGADPVTDVACPVRAEGPLEIPFVASYAYSDPITTYSLAKSGGSLCLSGIAVSSGNDYVYWGAELVLQLAPFDSAGNIVEGFDAASLEIAQVAFQVSDIQGRALNVSVNEIDDPRISEEADNFSINAFFWGGVTRGK